MKLIPTIIFSLCALSQIVGAQTPASPDSKCQGIADPVKFDEWSDIDFHDEKARLDNIAIELQHEPQFVVYMIIYAGPRACLGEAQARGVRAENYLIKKDRIQPDRILWIDGGYREHVTVEVWMLLRDWSRPFTSPTLQPSEIRIDKHCKIKHRAKVKS
jgi:hypothetical protein